MSGAAHARALLLACALVVVPSLARAEHVDDVTPFHLVYEAVAEGCPDARAFLGAVRARTERTRLAGAGESAVTLTVRIQADPAGPVVGRLAIREPDAAPQERSVQSETCTEVAKALALVVALYLDPDATSTASPPPPPPPASAPPAAPPPFKEERPAPSVRIAAGAGLGLQGGIGPSAAPLARLFGEAGFDVLPQARASVRLSLDGATADGDAIAGSQRYFLLAGTLRLCPFDARIVRAVHLGPCGGMQAGVTRGSSEGVANAHVQDRAWAAPSATAHATWQVSELVGLELEGGAGFPLVRTRYFLEPNVTVWRTPGVIGIANAAISFSFR